MQAEYAQCRHIEVDGLALPWSRIYSTYTLNPSTGLIASIEERTELPTALTVPALSLTTPLLSLSQPLMPAIKQISE